MPQFVRLVNTDAKSFDFHHNNIKKVVPPGGDTIVPWGIACTLFGDPTLVDTPRDPARTLSLKQARGTFNYMLGMEVDDGFNPDGTPGFNMRRPHVEVWDVEQSPPQRVYMLIEDPDGERENIGLASQAGMSEIQVLQNQVAVLTQHLANLTSRQMEQQMANRPDGQTIIPSNDAAPQPSYVPSPDVATDDQGKVRVMSQGLMDQLNLTPEQIAIIQAQQMTATIAEAAHLSSDPMAQFVVPGMSEYPDDTLADLNRIPPAPIPAFASDETLTAGQLGELGDLVLAGTPAATVDAPPSASPAAKSLPPRPGKSV